MRKLLTNCSLLFLLTFVLISCTISPEQDRKSKVNYLTDYEPKTVDGLVNVVVEIPAGTLEKWEVSKPSGKLSLNMIDGKPRIIQYLGYPGNYGMIPQTLLPKALGGDGDPLDVLVLGSPVERGDVVGVKIIGVLRLLDGGEQDDKLIAVQKDSPLYGINSVAELEANFKGVTEIINLWFSHYKGEGVLETNGFYGREKAMEILESAILEYTNAQ
ncbi:inorganic diphosphatase [Roseivirga misakiensis]|uniref:inorganic diphosphatase n=1 Tax=Roseivirga misakiensis TaxID=1563681 RepID=A0A1E5SKX2_9BACT|nr:inorganic diphosphatase [Roseivirga misakiensis]OEJ99770.1 hypothetical protein BFP71_09405 [Roseivirga misakiensis]